MSDPIIAIAHAYEGQPVMTTLFVGPDAQVRHDLFQSELREHWHWDEGWSHHPLTELYGGHSLEADTTWLFLADSLHPNIRQAMRHATQAGVAALVLTHGTAQFPADITCLEMAAGLDHAGALRALIGGAVRQYLNGIDWADIREFFVRQPQRLIQRMAAISEVEPVHLATAQALDSFDPHAADLALATCVMAWISVGNDFCLDDYYQVGEEIQARVSETCFVIIAVDPERVSMDGKKVVITAGWD